MTSHGQPSNTDPCSTIQLTCLDESHTYECLPGKVVEQSPVNDPAYSTLPQSSDSDPHNTIMHHFVWTQTSDKSVTKNTVAVQSCTYKHWLTDLNGALNETKLIFLVGYMQIFAIRFQNCPPKFLEAMVPYCSLFWSVAHSSNLFNNICKL